MDDVESIQVLKLAVFPYQGLGAKALKNSVEIIDGRESVATFLHFAFLLPLIIKTHYGFLIKLDSENKHYS